MGNQYSITVSDETAKILEDLKGMDYKVSQVIDEAVKTLGMSACMRLVAYRRLIKTLRGAQE